MKVCTGKWYITCLSLSSTRLVKVGLRATNCYVGRHLPLKCSTWGLRHHSEMGNEESIKSQIWIFLQGRMICDALSRKYLQMHILSHILSIGLVHPSCILSLSPRSDLSSANIRRHLGKLSKRWSLGTRIKWSHCLPGIMCCQLWRPRSRRRSWLSCTLVGWIHRGI